MIRRPKQPAADSAGSATVWLLAGILAAGTICGAWVAAGLAATARQHAETAADLAALAAAQRAASPGSVDPCSAAAAVARRNGATLESCTVAGTVVSVQVAVGRPVSARASARAGRIEP